MSHANISVFVPHLGCPNKCSFCNQRYIAGDTPAPQKADVEEAVQIAVKSKNYNPSETEIAFFGGSFTAIEKDYMVSLLEAAYRFVKEKKVKGIRISTRPDAIDERVLEILKNYGVTAIELGAQSMNDEVLLANNRGHNADDIEKASRLIKQYGFELGLQMMTGLYKSTPEKDTETAIKIAALHPETVRIYPTIVLEDTELCDRYKNKEYFPQSVSEAVDLCVKLLEIFKNENITVIRTGLHTIDFDRYVAGPWHPAFKELCDSAMFYERIKKELTEKGDYEISVNPSDVSKVIGQKKENIQKFKENGFNCKIKADSNIKKEEYILRRVKISAVKLDTDTGL